ncbi:MAG TPA: TonB-dependent siderophore receptor [Thermoanaerobaculia bacterium]
MNNKIVIGTLVAYTIFHGSVEEALAAATPAPTPAPSAAELPVRRFDIAAGPLDGALRAFEETSGVTINVRFPREVLRNLDTNGVRGLMTNEQALAQLLTDSGISHRFTSRRAATLQLDALEEAIDVTAPKATISSPKFSGPLVDTPQTVAVITSEVFTAQGATTLRDVLRNTPGITFQAGEGGGGLPGDTFSMRGFSAGNDITLDGVREVGAYTRDAFNLEQVEVVKGPSSVTSGRGATGGSINLVTKTPQSEAFTRISGAAGTEDHSRLAVDMNEAMSNGVALRLNAMMTRGGVAGRDVVSNESWGLAPSLAIGLGKPTRLTLGWQHLEQDNVPDYGLPWAALETPNVDQTNFYGLENYDYEEVRSDVATMTIDRDVRNGWLLRNTSRWADNHRDSAITAPRPPNRQLQQRLMDHAQLANATTFSGTRGRHDLVFGAEVARETTLTRRQAQTTNQPQTNLLDPDPSQAPMGPMPENLGNREETTLDVAGIYAFDTIHLGTQWQVSGGLRFDRIDARTTLLAQSLEKEESMLSWRAGAVYKPRANASLYASASTSFNPSVEAGSTGAGLSESPTAINNLALEPEKTRNYEIGGKLESTRAALTAAIFRTEKTNARTRSATSEPYVMAGEQRVDGAEVSVSGQLTSRWSLLAAYAHLSSEIVASANGAEEGNAMAFVPENSFNVWTTGALPGGVTLGGGAQYMDAVFRNATNTTAVPSYWLLNAMASVEVTRALTLRFNVNNIADESYVDRVGGGHYIPGARRTVVLSADFDF